MENEEYIQKNFNSVVSLKTSFEEDENTVTEFELLTDKKGYFNTSEINLLRDRYSEKKDELERLTEEYERLTNHADYLDYTIAASCGVLCGMLDIFFVGELNLTEAKEWGNGRVDEFVRKTAQLITKKGDYSSDQAGLRKAILDLEREFPIPADLATTKFGGGKQHHLRDFSHHPNFLGLLFSLLTQFTGKVYGTDVSGNFLAVDVSDTGLIGLSFQEKMMLGIVQWFFHIVSDTAGSSSTAGGGTGLPGPILSLLKMASVSPIFKDENGINNLSLIVSKAFNGTLFAERDEYGKIIKESVVGIDFRTELGIFKQQAGPVILNEILVRSFYFISRLIKDLQENQIRNIEELKRIHWKKCIPANNRTIIRMLSIATTAFTIVDLADAAIHSAYKAGGNAGTFVGQVILRVNFVGIGRTIIAISTDISMEFQRNKIEDKIEKVFLEELCRYNDLLKAERIHLEKIVCWDLPKKVEQIQDIYNSRDGKEKLDSSTDKYLSENGLDTQFSDFESFSKFMLNSDEELII